jgi:hypothetical protein
MRRLLVVLSFLAMFVAGTASASASAGVGKTGLYKDGCGNTHVWVNGNDLGPQYFVCIPPE